MIVIFQLKNMLYSHHCFGDMTRYQSDELKNLIGTTCETNGYCKISAWFDDGRNNVLI